jgi:predicted ATPase
VGRDAELDAVLEALEASPVVTLVGPGGIGTTTLALAAARRWQGDRLQRVWLAELAEIATSDDVQRAVGETLGSPRAGEA